MSWWLTGRYSPFSVNPPPRAPLQVTEDDYHYIDPADMDYFPTNSNNSSSLANARYAQEQDENTPDILILKHRGTTYPLHFQPFAIGEGLLKVGRLRELAAQKTSTRDPRRIKLLYKGKQLKDDAVACCDEGLKCNSELMCVVSEALPSGAADSESESASEDEMMRDERTGGGVRVDVDGSIIGDTSSGGRSRRKGHRGGKRKPKSSGTSTPITTPIPASSTVGSGSTAPFDSSLPFTAPPDPNRPKTALETIEALRQKFNTEFVPKCVAFINDPPKDDKARNVEYARLTETILGQIQLKLDGVETEGREEVRNKRKALTRDIQAMFSRLDAVMGKK